MSLFVRATVWTPVQKVTLEICNIFTVWLIAYALARELRCLVISHATSTLAGLNRKHSSSLVAVHRYLRFSSGDAPVPGGIIGRWYSGLAEKPYFARKL